MADEVGIGAEAGAAGTPPQGQAGAAGASKRGKKGKKGAKPAATKPPRVPRAPRLMNLVLVQEVSATETLDPRPEGTVLLRVLVDEKVGLKTEQDVTKWMEDTKYEGELYVLAFRRGAGKRAGTNDRMRRRRFLPVITQHEIE